MTMKKNTEDQSKADDPTHGGKIIFLEEYLARKRWKHNEEREYSILQELLEEDPLYW